MRFMERKELLEWAVRGINEEIASIEMKIARAYIYLNDWDNYKGTLTQDDIRSHVREWRAEIKELSKKESDLRWEIDVELNENGDES